MALLTLLNKNKKIFDFVYDINEHLVISFELNYKENEKYAPFRLIKDGKIDKIEFNKWWKNRQIPASRNGLKEVLNQNSYDKDNFDLLDSKAYCLSLSDQYWVKEKDSNIKWKDVNFFNNAFSEDIGKILFNNEKSPVGLNLNTPDMTSNGNYEKRWKIIDGKRFLIKAGSKVLNQEPFNEMIATKLYERLLNDKEYVKYSIIKDGNRAICICENFIDEYTELVPAWKINEHFEDKSSNKYEHYIACCERLGLKNVRQSIDKMLVCDYILANKDRHFNNFGVIRNVESLDFLTLAPIFDNGCSLWYDENDIYVGEFFLTKPFEEYENEQIKLVKDFSWIDIGKLDGFTEEVRKILESNELLTKVRIDKIINEIAKRIQYIKNKV